VSKAYYRLLKNWDFFGKRTLRTSSQKYSWGRRVKNLFLIDSSPPATTLNIDELVRGFQRGIVEFRRVVAADAELQSRFKEYIVSD
jgi:hypothetical protein